MTVSVDAAASLVENARSDPSTLSRLAAELLNEDGSRRLSDRFRALFTLKALGTNECIDIISKAFNDHSDLLKHELAYVLGQMKNVYAVPHLTAVLEDHAQAPMVRHEAAEALGAIADKKALPVLERYSSDPERVVRETCELAIRKIQFENSTDAVIPQENSLYLSVDPAPPSLTKDVKELKTALMDVNLPLFDRYRAMFALRNDGSEDAVLALASGFADDSALFRHEIAYVFGQMRHVASVPSLIQTLTNNAEVSMVRHECAEALGSIATRECIDALQKYTQDPERVVSESCVVGLDMAEYEADPEQFQYADGLVKA
ncbi:armadillo-type protein [Cladochytrium replicatum]|nr:armadillo-type protein [Cladochytrium replicatum]